MAVSPAARRLGRSWWKQDGVGSAKAVVVVTKRWMDNGHCCLQQKRADLSAPLFPVCHLFSFFIELLQWRGITGGYWRLKEWERNRPTSERVGRPKTTSGVQVPMSAGWQSIKIKTGQSNQPPSHTNVLLITYRRSGPFLYLFFPQFTSRRLILSIAAARASFTNI